MHHLSVYLVTYVILHKSKCVQSQKRENTSKIYITLQSNGSESSLVSSTPFLELNNGHSSIFIEEAAQQQLLWFC